MSLLQVAKYTEAGGLEYDTVKTATERTREILESIDKQVTTQSLVSPCLLPLFPPAPPSSPEEPPLIPYKVAPSTPRLKYSPGFRPAPL